MNFINLLCLVLSVVSVVLAANTKAYDAVQKAAGSKKLTLGRQYAFKTGSRIGHQRLIVGKVTGKPGSLDFDANVYELFKYEDPAKKGKFRTTVGATHSWDCSRGKYSYKGEVLTSLRSSDIQQKGHDLMVGRERYSKLTNNCQHYVKNLYKEIRARALLDEYLRIRRSVHLSELEFTKRSLENLY